MAEVSDAAKAKARELLGEWPAAGVSNDIVERFARYIQQVSDAAKGLNDGISWSEVAQGIIQRHLAPFILPDPVDPLSEAIAAANVGTAHGPDKSAELLRAELAKRRLKIVPSDA